MSIKLDTQAAFVTVTAFVATHPELLQDRLVDTVSTILGHMKAKKLEMTSENMEQAWDEIQADILATCNPEEIKSVALDEAGKARISKKASEDAETEKYRKQIDSLTADELKEYLKDEAVATAVNSVLNEPRPKKVEPKPQPKPQPKKPVRTAEEQAIENMSADELKRAIAKSPEIARGIENTLAAAARRNSQ